MCEKAYSDILPRHACDILPRHARDILPPRFLPLLCKVSHVRFWASSDGIRHKTNVI